MKKTLHGKRYLRSRASIQIGRRKKAERKFERFIFFLNQMPKMIEVVSAGLIEFSNAIQEVTEKVRVIYIDKLHSIYDPTGFYRDAPHAPLQPPSLCHRIAECLHRGINPAIRRGQWIALH